MSEVAKMVNRQEHNEHFTMIDNAVLNNVNLSWEARGFLAYLLSLPDDWSFSLGGLIKRTGSSRSVILRICRSFRLPGMWLLTDIKTAADASQDAPGTYMSMHPFIPQRAKQIPNSPQFENSTSGDRHEWRKPQCGKTRVRKTRLRKNHNMEKRTITKY